jgi:hypothetical protein
MSDLRAWHRARAVGAADEAQRLGCSVVGTEHLLMAAVADPIVLCALRTVGVDAHSVEAEVVRVSRRRRAASSDGGITTEAADAVMQACAGSEALDEDEPRRADVARVLQELARRFLSRNRHSDARDVLDGLGAIKYRTRLLATIEHEARRASPPPEGGASSRGAPAH